jgi:hypothetical protein
MDMYRALLFVLLSSGIVYSQTVPHWADDLGVRLHPAVGLRVSDGEPKSEQLAVIDGSIDSKHDIGLYAARHIPHKSTVLLRVPPRALLVANTTESLVLRVAELIARSRLCAGNSSSFTECDDDNPFNAYVSDVSRRPGLLRFPAAVLSTGEADACLAPHFAKLYAHATAEWRRLLKSATEAKQQTKSNVNTTKGDLRRAWAIVRTRAITAPTHASRHRNTSVILAPLLDFANHNGTLPTAQIEYQRHSVMVPIVPGEEEEIRRERRSDELDVLLVSTVPLKKGADVTIDYANVRHPVDAVDTYGYLPVDTSSGAEAADKQLAKAFPQLPLQIVFPRDDEFIQARGCSNASLITFDANTGKPAANVLPCAVLTHLKGRGEVDGLLAMQDYVAGVTKKEHRRELARAAYGSLAHEALKLRDEYSMSAERRSRCVALIGSGKASKAKVDVVAAATAVTMFMRDAIVRLAGYCAKRAEGEAPPKDAVSTGTPVEEPAEL